MYWRSKVRPAIMASTVCALLTACSGAISQVAPDQPAGGSSWVATKTTSQNLLYISDLGANSVDIYPYPSGSLIGKLTGFGSVAGLCSDKAGDVFVVDEAGPVQVFAHGGTSPIRKLTASGAPNGCSVDPVTGNLALTQLSAYLYGALAIYPKAKGAPKEIQNSDANSTYYCGYDNEGNLFVDGNDHYGKFVLWEMPKGKSTMNDLKFTKTVTDIGGVAWDGSYVAVGDKGAGLIYRTKRGTGVVAQTVTLKDGTDVEQFWIQGSTLVGPNAASPGDVFYYHYPGGGSPSKTLNAFYYPIAATVSLTK